MKEKFNVSATDEYRLWKAVQFEESVLLNHSLDTTLYEAGLARIAGITGKVNIINYLIQYYYKPCRFSISKL